MHASELKLPNILAHAIGIRFAMVSVAFLFWICFGMLVP